MRNAYKAVCYKCNRLVPPNTGYLEKYGKIWRVKHIRHTLKNGQELSANRVYPSPAKMQKMSNKKLKKIIYESSFFSDAKSEDAHSAAKFELKERGCLPEKYKNNP